MKRAKLLSLHNGGLHTGTKAEHYVKTVDVYRYFRLHTAHCLRSIYCLATKYSEVGDLHHATLKIY